MKKPGQLGNDGVAHVREDRAFKRHVEMALMWAV